MNCAIVSIKSFTSWLISVHKSFSDLEPMKPREAQFKVI